MNTIYLRAATRKALWDACVAAGYSTTVDGVEQLKGVVDTAGSVLVWIGQLPSQWPDPQPLNDATVTTTFHANLYLVEGSCPQELQAFSIPAPAQPYNKLL